MFSVKWYSKLSFVEMSDSSIKVIDKHFFWNGNHRFWHWSNNPHLPPVVLGTLAKFSDEFRFAKVFFCKIFHFARVFFTFFCYCNVLIFWDQSQNRRWQGLNSFFLLIGFLSDELGGHFQWAILICFFFSISSL